VRPRGARAAAAGLVAVAVLAVWSLGPGSVAADQPQLNSPWPQFKRDGPKTGRAALNGPARPVQRWVYNAGSPIVSGPVIGADGTVYAGTENARLLSVKPDGKEGCAQKIRMG
jgi:hypothetical protein